MPDQQIVTLSIEFLLTMDQHQDEQFPNDGYFSLFGTDCKHLSFQKVLDLFGRSCEVYFKFYAHLL